MKSSTAVVVLTGLCLLFTGLVIGVRQGPPTSSPPADPGRRTYSASGVVRSVNASSRTLQIAHEAIPGLMPAMTMPFRVDGHAWPTGVRPGDTIDFRLVVTFRDSWIDSVRRVSDQPDAELEAVSPEDREATRLQVGERVPDLTLVDQDGHAFRWSDLHGNAIVLTFVYTRCPLPNFCPLMTQNFAELQRRLRPEFGDQVRLLSISIDPIFDTPGVLRNYAAQNGVDSRFWTLVTGSEAGINQAAELFGLFRQAAGGLINHDLRTALIGPDGRLVSLWKGNAWTPYEVQRQVREILTGSRDLAAQ